VLAAALGVREERVRLVAALAALLSRVRGASDDRKGRALLHALGQKQVQPIGRSKGAQPSSSSSLSSSAGGSAQRESKRRRTRSQSDRAGAAGAAADGLADLSFAAPTDGRGGGGSPH
jgi:hypothetical protein